MGNFLDNFRAALIKKGSDGVITTIAELRENQFGFPLRHYAQQYLFGATGLRIHVFNSIQGPKEVGKSVLLYELLGDISESVDTGGLGGLSFLYELETKISPTILYPILKSHGEDAQKHCCIRQGYTLDSAMEEINTIVIPTYLKSYPDRDKPLLIGLDSIGGAATGDTLAKLQEDGVAGKGYWNKPHFMKYFCENQGMLLLRENIPAVVICINQEKDVTVGVGPFARTQKAITGGVAQLFKDGHMLSISKSALKSGDGNQMFIKTTKTSFCDSRQISVEFRWNKFGRNADDPYESRFLWGLAAAQFLSAPDKGMDIVRDICDVRLDKDRVTCKQLGLTAVTGDEFEAALMADTKMLDQLYVLHKIERLKTLADFAAYLKTQSTTEKPVFVSKEVTVKTRNKPGRQRKTAPVPEPELMPDLSDEVQLPPEDDAEEPEKNTRLMAPVKVASKVDM